MTLTDRKDKENINVTLPSGWHYSKLKDVINYAQPGFACGTRSSVGIIQLRMNNVDTRGNFVWNEYLRVPIEVTDLDKYRLKQGDILFNNTNSTELVGKSALFQGNAEPVVYSNHFTRIRVNTKFVFPDYIVSWLIWQYRSGTFANLCNRWIGQSAIKNEILFNLEIPVPPLAEQECMSRILNKQMTAVEKARAAAEARLEAAKALTAAYLREVFPQPGQELPKGWKWVRLGDVFDVKQGVAMSPTRRQGITPHPFLRTLNIQWGRVDLSNLDKMDFNNDEIKSLKIEEGDLLVCEGGDVGRTAIWRGELDDCLYQNHIHRLRQKDDSVIPDFYLYWLQAAILVFHAYQGKNSTTTIPNLSGGQLKSFLMPLAPKNEQNQIVNALNERIPTVEQLNKTIQEELDTINTLPVALLGQAFSGGI